MTDLVTIAAQVEAIGSAMAELKSTNDTRFEEIQTKGIADPLVVEKQMKLETSLEAMEAALKELRNDMVRQSVSKSSGVAGDYSPVQVKHAEAFDSWLRDPNNGEKAQAMNAAALEAKAVSSATSSGGHAIPEMIGSRIQETLQKMSPMRDILDVITVGTSDYKELVDVNGETGGWVGETGTRSATGTPSLEQVAPTFGEVYCKPEVYEHILDDAFFDIAGWLIRKVGEEMARLEGEAFLTGNGTNKPTGFLSGTPEAAGDFDSPARTFGELQYLPTGVAAGFQNDLLTSPAGDPFAVFSEAIHAMRSRWRAGALFMMNTTTKGVLRRFRDADGRYLMRSSLEAGEGDQLLGYGIVEMDHMPDIGANAFPVAFGNFREAYLAAERTSLRITIDDNITTPGSVKYYVRRRVGGILRQDQAIKAIKCATS